MQLMCVCIQLENVNASHLPIYHHDEHQQSVSVQRLPPSVRCLFHYKICTDVVARFTDAQGKGGEGRGEGYFICIFPDI